MMTKRTIQAAVVALALAASASIAHAGGGGAGSPVSGGIFDCYVVNGDNAPQVLSIDDQFGSRTGVKLGKARLLCTPATNAIVESGQLQPGDFSSATDLNCYETPPRGANPKVNVQVVDPFVADTVRVGPTLLTCVQAFTCPVGVPCGP